MLMGILPPVSAHVGKSSQLFVAVSASLFAFPAHPSPTLNYITYQVDLNGLHYIVTLLDKALQKVKGLKTVEFVEAIGSNSINDFFYDDCGNTSLNGLNKFDFF